MLLFVKIRIQRANELQVKEKPACRLHTLGSFIEKIEIEFKFIGR